MKIKNTLVVYTKLKNLAEKQTLQVVEKTLKKYNVSYIISKRESLNKKLFQNKDFIIAVGGDGTFLRASHFIFDTTPILGVNSNPKSKEGFFMSAAKKDFDKKFNKIINNSFKIKKLNRLEAYLDNKKIPELALNEFYISSKKEYHTARYYLTIRGQRERQKSSGIIISTAAGSYAWMKSAGGKQLPLNSDKFEYIVREPYCGRISAKCGLVNGILDKDKKIIVEFELGDGMLIADSLSVEHTFKAKEKVTVRMSNKPLHSVSF
ncbi:NAD(+)/NADH kinase [Candidatus Woesearchaeota archaeon]|nr:NAD(+)/NADH kinase [Candidatus Woesearchaeota archaeon]